MLYKILIASASFLPTLAMAGNSRWCAPEIDGGAAILGLAILGGLLSFIKKRG